jgi:hypothetical protein
MAKSVAFLGHTGDRNRAWHLIGPFPHRLRRFARLPRDALPRLRARPQPTCLKRWERCRNRRRLAD